MNKFLSNTLNGTAFGIGFTIILVIYIVVYNIYEESSDDSDYKYEDADLNIIQISNVRLIKIGKIPSVVIDLKNQSDSRIYNAKLDVRLMNEEGLFGICEGYFHGIQPNISKEELIECNNFNSEDLPENTNVEVEVVFAKIEK